MENREKALCDGFVEYMAGQAPEVDRKRFERHLLTCAACREDAAEWRYVWDRLAEDAPAVEPPADLKANIMNAIFAGESQEAHHQTTERSRSRVRQTVRWLAGIAAAVLLFMAGTWWQQSISPTKQAAGQIGAPPSQIDKIYPLEAVMDSGKFKPGGHAYGVACLIRSNGDEQLVVYVFGTPQTEDSEAYHVWLLKEGKRSSAGTFTVGSSGIGLLTLPWQASEGEAFDSVGITLEPDANSEEPRGPKLFGSA
ncbi:anti-sigma factor [Cohnella pontilimi]|uniref:Anti-sigma-W factor RsiW n=1 Tax=Cohnella pontilimi TaxID=2564100 RepID=A0A4U0FH06_9BACL|nr:anti-sigma factor [Cohnella pontilimi]TJY44198.1 anti-sigma factor [Cohnella pontilimi]